MTLVRIFSVANSSKGNAYERFVPHSNAAGVVHVCDRLTSAVSGSMRHTKRVCRASSIAYRDDRTEPALHRAVEEPD